MEGYQESWRYHYINRRRVKLTGTIYGIFYPCVTKYKNSNPFFLILDIQNLKYEKNYFINDGFHFYQFILR